MSAPSDSAILEGLITPVRDSVNERGMVPLTEPQRIAMPIIMAGANVLVISPTGMGKTEAALVPIINEMVRSGLRDREGIKVLYITPLRALNRDLLDRIAWWATRHDFSVSVRHGDSSKGERRSQALRPPDILITTPETFQIILVGRRLRKHISKVKWVVVDELHEIAADKRGSQLALGLERLRMILQEEPQIVGLSATVGSPEELAAFLVGNGRQCKVAMAMVPRDIEIKLVFPRPTPEDVSSSEVLLAQPEVAARVRLIAKEIASHNSVLVFTNTRATAETISNKLFMLGSEIPISIHHGSLGVATRVTAESGLKFGSIRGVVTTSSLELGIDVGSIDFVMQYGSPRQATHLIQRIGRSGHRVGMVPRGEIIAIDAEDAIEALVVRDRALRGEIEPVQPPVKPLDVLAHQTLGLLFWEPRFSIDRILSLFVRSNPYRGLGQDELERVLEFLQQKYPALLYYSKEQGVVSRGRSAKEIFEYYFGHVSTIPEVKHYPVTVERKKDVVGELDEEFVAEKGLVGTKFIMAGKVWSITRVSDGAVFVEGVTDPLGAVPYWVGEEIPVPFVVAREVGQIRGWIAKMLAEGKDMDSIVMTLAQVHEVDADFARNAISTVAETHLSGYPIATDRKIVCERCSGVTIIHVCLGDKANRSLSKLLGSYFSKEIGTTITTNRDPYRVIINYDLPPQRVIQALQGFGLEQIDSLLSIGLESFGMFKRRLLHVARRFGVVPRDVDLTSLELDKLTEELRDTVVFEEAKKELFQKDYDLATLANFLSSLKNGSYEVEIIEGREPSPLAKAAISNLDKKYDIFPPEKADRILLRYAQIRLENAEFYLVCLSCKRYLGLKKAREIADDMRCQFCGSTDVGLARSDEDARAFRYRPNSRIGKRVEEFLRWSSTLIHEYGGVASVAIASRGLPKEEIEMILREAPLPGEKLVRLIIDAERNKAARIA